MNLQLKILYLFVSPTLSCRNLIVKITLGIDRRATLKTVGMPDLV